MLTLRGRIARRIAHWKNEMATRRAIAHLDDRLREDAGLPRRDSNAPERSHLRNPYFDL
jgi:uncharacterized protein YjiS (DUF1127 family)